MQQILLFFIKNKNFLLFFVLFSISVALTFQSHSFHQSKLVSSANFFSGRLYSIKRSITGYFDLDQENKKLILENARLRTLVFNTNIDVNDTLLKPKFNFITAQIIKNSYAGINNKITLNKGKKDGIKPDMGVITSLGIIGIVENTSANYAVVQSILNTNSQIFVKLKNSNHFGFLKWNGKDPNILQVIDFPPLAPVKKGDTIVTGGNSAIFPKGILVGTISDFSYNKTEREYFLTVRLFNDMTDLNYVYIIKNNHYTEIKNLENNLNHAE